MLKDILKNYEGQKVGVNIQGSSHIDEVLLQNVGEDYFSVVASDDDNTYHIPYSHIAHIAENPKGVKEGKFLFRIRTDLPVFIRLGPQIQYIVG